MGCNHLNNSSGLLSVEGGDQKGERPPVVAESLAGDVFESTPQAPLMAKARAFIGPIVEYEPSSLGLRPVECGVVPGCPSVDCYPVETRALVLRFRRVSQGRLFAFCTAFIRCSGLCLMSGLFRDLAFLQFCWLGRVGAFRQTADPGGHAGPCR